MPPVFNQYCNGCGICAAICPTDVFNRTKARQVPTVLYPDECWHCDSCVLDCPGDEDGRKGVELRIPLQMQLLWVDPAEKVETYEIIGDHLGFDPENAWDMPRE